MKKLIPKNQNRTFDDWVEKILYKPGTNKISNRFLKNPVSHYIYKCNAIGVYLENIILLVNVGKVQRIN